jgi:hypothetical protein
MFSDRYIAAGFWPSPGYDFFRNHLLKPHYCSNRIGKFLACYIKEKQSRRKEYGENEKIMVGSVI